MQEHGYPASHEPLIFSTGMAGIPDDDAIEVEILHPLCHTEIPIDVHDLDKVAPRIVAVGASETSPAAAARPSFSKRAVAGDRALAQRRATRVARDTRIACAVHTSAE